jgi:perosamine synthetase
VKSNYLISVYQPLLNGREKDYVLDCLNSNWISSKGPYINKFEIAFASFIDCKHAATCSNGTVALHLAMLALKIGPDDEVIVPTLTYIASVNAIAYVGAKPVFVDSLPDTWQMDPEDVRSKITSKTKAIVVVHLYGHPCDMDALTAIAREYGLFIIEDCAEAIGSYYKGHHVGTFGDVATFSFYGNKAITTGEGGMVVTNSDHINDMVYRYKGQGLAKGREYWHDIIGYNYRMTNICAAIGLAQLESINDVLYKKRQIAQWYEEVLASLPLTFHKKVGDVVHSYWMVSAVVDKIKQRDILRVFLAKNGIETRPFFCPVHTMQMYKQDFQSLPVADDLSARGINLPSGAGLSKESIVFIGQYIKKFFFKRDCQQLSF